MDIAHEIEFEGTRPRLDSGNEWQNASGVNPQGTDSEEQDFIDAEPPER
jgi:hypothetical protein